MKVAEIFKHVIDLLAQEEQANQSQPDSEENATDNVGVFVPPLQQKMEMHKKAHGLDNIYDQVNDQQPDELAVIKKNAGLTNINSEEDEPFDG